MFKMDEREIFAQCKGMDSDQIYARKKLLINSSKGVKFAGIGMMILGVPMLLAIIGFLMIPVGFFLWKIGKDNFNITEEATAKYCRKIGIEDV